MSSCIYLFPKLRNSKQNQERFHKETLQLVIPTRSTWGPLFWAIGAGRRPKWLVRRLAAAAGSLSGRRCEGRCGALPNSGFGDLCVSFGLEDDPLLHVSNKGLEEDNAEQNDRHHKWESGCCAHTF